MSAAAAAATAAFDCDCADLCTKHAYITEDGICSMDKLVCLCVYIRSQYRIQLGEFATSRLDDGKSNGCVTLRSAGNGVLLASGKRNSGGDGDDDVRLQTMQFRCNSGALVSAGCMCFSCCSSRFCVLSVRGFACVVTNANSTKKTR